MTTLVTSTSRGDLETHAIDADTSDFFPQQFIGPARDTMCNEDNEHDATSNDAAKISSAEVFNSEDVPSPNNFRSHKVKHMLHDDDGEQYEFCVFETHAINVDTPNVSSHQFIAPDETCDPKGSDDTEQNAASNDAAKSKILSAEIFDSEDVLSPDNFPQTRLTRKQVKFEHANDEDSEDENDSYDKVFDSEDVRST